MTWSNKVWAAVAVMVGMFLAEANAGQQTGLPPHIQQALEASAAAMDPILLTWTRERESDIGLDGLVQRLGPETSPALLEPHHLRYRLQGDCLYLAEDIPSAEYTLDGQFKRVSRSKGELAYTGNVLYMGGGSEPRLIFSKVPPGDVSPPRS